MEEETNQENQMVHVVSLLNSMPTKIEFPYGICFEMHLASGVSRGMYSAMPLPAGERSAMLPLCESISDQMVK